MTPMRILVADDDPQNQRMLALILKRRGYSPRFASSGLEVLTAISTNDFDLVLMDVLMPQMDGIEATRQIRLLENGERHIPIVGLTAVMEVEYKRCLQAGMDHVLSKPLDVDALEKLIMDILETGNVSHENSPSKKGYPPIVLDIESAVHRLGGDHESYRELLSEFISLLPERFSELTSDFQSKEWTQLSLRAHNLKGLSASIGALELSRIAMELDQLANESTAFSIEQKLTEVKAGINSLNDTALAYLDENPDGRDI